MHSFFLHTMQRYSLVRGCLLGHYCNMQGTKQTHFTTLFALFTCKLSIWMRFNIDIQEDCSERDDLRSSLSEKMLLLLQGPGILERYAICTCSIVTSEVLLLDDGTLVQYAICNMHIDYTICTCICILILQCALKARSVPRNSLSEELLQGVGTLLQYAICTGICIVTIQCALAA